MAETERGGSIESRSRVSIANWNYRFAVVVGELLRPPSETQPTTSWLSRFTNT